MVSGQHDTCPISRWPRALAALIASRSANTASGLVLLCSSAAIITGRRERAAICSSSATGICAPLVTMYTPRPLSPMASMSARCSSSLARREGIGAPPAPLCAGLVELARPTAPAAMASRTSVAICAISSALAARWLAAAPIT